MIDKDVVEFNITLQPLEKLKSYAGVVFVGKVLGPAGITDLMMVFPTRDRRKARRVARKANMVFWKARDGTYKFRKKRSIKCQNEA